MKLTEKIYDQTFRNATEFARLREQFSIFVQEVEAMTTDRKPPGFTVVKNDNEFSFDTTFAGTRIRFQMFPAYDDKLHLIGKIYVTRQSHRLSNAEEVLGVVTFNQFGTSDVEDADPSDCYTLSASAKSLVAHFSHEAIAKPVSLPTKE